MPFSIHTAHASSPSRPLRRAAARRTAVIAAVLAVVGMALAAPAGAQTDPATPPSTSTPQAPPPTTAPPAPQPTPAPAPPASLPPGLPVVDPPVDPSQPPPPPPAPIADPSQQVETVVAQLHILDLRAALDVSQATLDRATALQTTTQALYDSAVRDRDARRKALADAATAAYVLGDGGQGDLVGADQPDGYVSAESERMLAGSAIQHTHDGVVAAEHKVDVAQGLLAAVRATADKARAARDAAQAQIDDANTALQQASKPVAPGTDVSPTVLGPPVLTIDEIVGWYQAQNITGYVGGVDLQTMVGYYVFEGAAEGVRGDVAFAQAMVETGAFTSPLTTHNNFAGIGACDSCATGFDFPTPQLGVRAQVQLLHAYADKGLVTLDLANPPVGADPDHLSVRGCCPTWNKLTGTWATDPNYGPKIMTIYLSMLEYAYAQRSNPQPAAGAPLPAISPSG
jgi:hypothetical protein